jgi:hypothetical protein
MSSQPQPLNRSSNPPRLSQTARGTTKQHDQLIGFVRSIAAGATLLTVSGSSARNTDVAAGVRPFHRWNAQVTLPVDAARSIAAVTFAGSIQTSASTMTAKSHGASASASAAAVLIAAARLKGPSSSWWPS